MKLQLPKLEKNQYPQWIIHTSSKELFDESRASFDGLTHGIVLSTEKVKELTSNWEEMDSFVVVCAPLPHRTQESNYTVYKKGSNFIVTVSDDKYPGVELVMTNLSEL